MDRVYISEGADRRLINCLMNEGYEIRLVGTGGIVAPPVSAHPDMFMCKTGIESGSSLVICPGIFPDEYYDDPSVISGAVKPGLKYPEDIAYNAACTGRYFIHNIRYTDPVLLAYVTECGMQVVNVRQGYAKCSTVVVDESSVITYDHGIAEACREKGMNVLSVSAGNVVLPGYDTGFIGGTSGRIGDTVYFNGDLSAHPDFRKIVQFIEQRGLRVQWFPDWPLTDTGSIILV